MVRRRVVSRTMKVAVGILIVFWSLAPIYWALVVSFSTASGIRDSTLRLLPTPFTPDNYVRLFSGVGRAAGSFSTAMVNSVIESGLATVLTITVALPAAYALARISFRGSALILTTLLVLIAMPVYLVLIPLFRSASELGLINTQLILIAIYASGTLPFAALILRGHIASLPESIEEAARLDGASTVTILLRIVRPLIAPGVVAAAVFTFLTCWGQYLVPVVFASSQDVQPLTVLIPKFATQFTQDLGLQAAAGIIALLPPALVVVLLQRHLIAGLVAGASR